MLNERFDTKTMVFDLEMFLDKIEKFFKIPKRPTKEHIYAKNQECATVRKALIRFLKSYTIFLHPVCAKSIYLSFASGPVKKY